MRKLLFASVSLLPWFAVYPAYAAPTFCTGTITTVSNGSTLPGSFFLNGTASSGNCAEAADKFIGGFSVSGSISGAGSSTFDFQMPTGPANVQLGIQGSIGGTAAATGGIVYSVAVDPLLSNGALIDDLGKDFTLGAADVTGAASATLTGTTTASTFAFDCGRTVNPSGGTGGAPTTCPEHTTFPTDVAQMTVTENLATGANAVVTGLTDTISQAVPGVSEPPTLAILGVALGMLSMIGIQRRRS